MIVGIDYSLNCATMCYESENGIKIVCSGLKLSQEVKRRAIELYPFVSFLSPRLPHVQSSIADQFVSFILSDSKPEFVIEGASFGSVGRHSDIGEGLGRLLHAIEIKFPDTKIYRPAPTTVKKHATRSGKAKKPQMIEAWCKRLDLPLPQRYGKRGNILPGIPEESPWSDFADAYWMMDYGNFNYGDKYEKN